MTSRVPCVSGVERSCHCQVAIPAGESGGAARCGGRGSAPTSTSDAPGVDLIDPEARIAGRAQADQVPDSQVLEVGPDLVGAVNVAARQVLQAVEAVEPTAALTDLHQPRPHPLRRRLDHDRAGVAEHGAGHQLIARHGLRDLGIGGAPAVVPPPPDGCCQRRREYLSTSDEHISDRGASHCPRSLPNGPPDGPVSSRVARVDTLRDILHGLASAQPSVPCCATTASCAVMAPLMMILLPVRPTRGGLWPASPDPVGRAQS